MLKAFDESTSQAQLYAQEAVKYSTMSRELMAKAHHECYSGIQKLIADALAEKRAGKERRRKAKNHIGAAASMLCLQTLTTEVANHRHTLHHYEFYKAPFFLVFL